MKVVVTGGAGLVGSHCCEFYAKQGHKVVAIDNYKRGDYFGKEGNTVSNVIELKKEFPDILFINMDIRSQEIQNIVKDADILIHTAAQPSHPKSIDIPIEDFQVNAMGTLNLLEILRQKNDDCIFVNCSTNKVYGENPNKIDITEKETRYDYTTINGINESVSLDQTMHTPFGVSKTTGDLYSQEYGTLYGLKTGTFRMGCITGPRSKAVELHNWIPYFFKVNMKEETLNVYGFKGKQVRDIIDARDLVIAFNRFCERPKPGEVYNIGGGRNNSVSLLEAFEKIENLTGKVMKYALLPQREGDHQVYITDFEKFQAHYDWNINIDLDRIFGDIYTWLIGNNMKES